MKLVNTLAGHAIGRIVLHVVAMCVDREFGFHIAGIWREF